MKILKLVLMISIAASLMGCGKNGLQIVKDFKSETQVDSAGDLQLSMSAKFNLGLLSLPQTKIPIRSRGAEVGVVEIAADNLITVLANLTMLSEGQLNPATTLPSGDAIPVSGIEPVFSLSITSRSKIYLGHKDKSTLFGLALVIPELDRLGSRYPFLDVWLPIKGATTSKGLAGIFAGSEPSTSGLGIFVVNESSNSPAAPQIQSLSQLKSAVQQSPTGSGTGIQLLSSRHSGLEKALFELSFQKRKLSLR